MSAPTSKAAGLARFVPGGTALLASGAIAVAFSPERAIPVALLGLLALGLAAAGVDVAGPVERGAAALGRGLFAAVTGVLYLVVFVPSWIVGRLVRKDSLRAAPRDADDSSTWTSRTATTADGAFSSGSVPGARRGLVGRIAWAIGCVVLVLGANYGIGWAWDRWQGASGPATFAEALDPTTTAGTRYDPRVESPALADAPWASEYLADLQRPEVGYWPYTELRPRDFSSPYINVSDWRRETLAPADADAPMPQVWMFGGSTTFGEGQRDEHTIASELVRIAEREGVPIQVANYGQRGWVHFQEMILFEQQLAEHDAPDLALFYDGANDVNVQALVDEAVPSHYQAELYAQKLLGSTLTTRIVDPTDDGSSWWDAWHSYTEHSAIHKVVAWLRPQRAEAAPATPAAPDAPAQDDGIDRDEQGNITAFPTEQDGTDAGQVYERGKVLTQALGERYDVPTYFFWLPLRGEGPAEKAAEAELTDSTIDVSDALDDHPEVFLDGVHTNEEGARLMAEVLWPSIEPQIREWYRSHG